MDEEYTSGFFSGGDGYTFTTEDDPFAKSAMGILQYLQGKVAGLQISDIVASGITAGVEKDFYGNCELRYAETLKPAIYNRNGNYLSYGMKFYPWAKELSLSEQQRALVAIFGG